MAGHEKLLAGWYRWIVFMDEQNLVRLDLETDERTYLCTVDFEVNFSIAIPGSPNVVIARIQDEIVQYRLI